MERTPIMSSGADRIVKYISRSRLVHNYQVLAHLCPEQLLLPMIKADAYGHGAVWAAKILKDLPKLAGFGVATIDEAIELRKQSSLKAIPVLVFSGGMPWSDKKASIYKKWNLTAILSSEKDWTLFYKKKHFCHIGYQLEWNTGMNRIGIEMAALLSVTKNLKSIPHAYWPNGVFSHLAQAEKPEHPQSRIQMKHFAEIRETLSFLSPHAAFHLANSAAIWKKKEWKLDELTDWIRPGVALYGHAPWYGASTNGLLPVMQLKTNVGTVQKVGPGGWVGYGGTYRTSKNHAEFVASATAGYGDGVVRHLSNKGSVWVKGKKFPILGRVSMDLFNFACSRSTRPGDSVEIFGDHLDCWQQAKSAGTIPYELMTSLTRRVATREY